MPNIKFTERTLQTLNTERGLEEFIDEDFKQAEFGLRVSRGGRKGFFLRYRVNGKRRRLTLGPYPATSLAQARTKALNAVLGVHDGKDPSKERAQHRQSDSVASLFEAFMK